jgi:hypothetical protein
MGLDMYLSAKHYVQNWDHTPEGKRHTVVVTKGGVPVELGDVTDVVERIGYWRKANAVHHWFVVNVQDGKDECQESYVSREQLQELRAACVEVLADPSKALDVLPPQGGFFFGSTAVDEYYLSDLRDTVAIVDAIEAKPKEWGGDIYYRASW